jgi:hypothetical protein
VSLASLLTETIDIVRKTNAAASSSNLGGHVQSDSTAYDDIPSSRPQHPGGKTQIEAARRNLMVNATFYTSTPVTVATGDIVSWNSLKYLVQWASDEGGQNRVFAIHTLLKS